MTNPNIDVYYEVKPAFVFSHEDMVEYIGLAGQPNDRIVRASAGAREYGLFGTGSYAWWGPGQLKNLYNELKACV